MGSSLVYMGKNVTWNEMLIKGYIPKKQLKIHEQIFQIKKHCVVIYEKSEITIQYNKIVYNYPKQSNP